MHRGRLRGSRAVERAERLRWTREGYGRLSITCSPGGRSPWRRHWQPGRLQGAPTLKIDSGTARRVERQGTVGRSLRRPPHHLPRNYDDQTTKAEESKGSDGTVGFTEDNAERQAVDAGGAARCPCGGGCRGGYALAKPSPAGSVDHREADRPLDVRESASFTYSDTDSIQKFQCSLDNAAFADCGTTNPATKSPAYSGLAAGSHAFQVRAVNANGTASATSYTWVVDLTPPTVASINRAAASPTNAATVSWTVTFSERRHRR